MSAPAFTPGPWRLTSGNPGLSTGLETADRRRKLARIYTGNDEYLANAHLIAAAPDMLAVLKAILADAHPDVRLRPDQIAGARAAIAKAERWL